MGLFKLFLFFVFSCFLNLNAFSEDISKKQPAGKKTVQPTKKIIRKSIAKQPNENIRKTDNRGSNSRTYQLSNKTINLKSPMCKYAKNNDVISLKKSLVSNNYNASEVNTVCENGESLFMIAVKNNNFLTAKFLMEKGADVNLQNDAGASPLHIISRNNSVEMNRILDLMLYKKDLNVNLRDQDGYTPIMRAVEFENVNCVEQITKLNVNLNIKNIYGKNVLDLAYKILDGKKTDAEREDIRKIIDLLKKKS